MPRIYLSPPHLAGTELARLEEALASNWIAPLGPHVDAFEQEFSQVVAVPHALALASGTAALHLALLALGVTRGDVVLCSTFTFAATANAIAYCDATPVFVDCDASWTLDPNLLDEALRRERAAGHRVAAVVSVDLYGQLCNGTVLREVCRRHEVALVQDAAEALGSRLLTSPSQTPTPGVYGDLVAYSFNGNKIITTSGGGMLVSHQREWLAFARKLSTQAREPAPHYQHEHIGYNYRLSNLLAGVGRAQLEVLPQRVAARRAVAARYREELQHAGLSWLRDASWCEGNAWLSCATFEPQHGLESERTRLHLEGQGIESRPLWKPMHLQPVFDGARCYGGAVSERLFATGLCLPSGSSLTEAQQAEVIAAVRETL